MKSFSLKRIWMLINIHLDARWKLYLASYAVLFLIMLFPDLFYYNNEGFYDTMFIFCLCFFGFLQAASFYGSWGNKGLATNYFMVPATIPEKFTVAMLFSNVLFVPVFTIFYVATSYLQVAIFESHFTVQQLSAEYLYCLKSGDFTSLIKVLIFTQSLFVLCAIWINKRQFVTGSVIFVILFISILMLTTYILKKTTGFLVSSPSEFFISNTGAFRKPIGPTEFHRFELSGIYGSINQLVWIIVGIGMYVAAYFKLKEKEI